MSRKYRKYRGWRKSHEFRKRIFENNKERYLPCYYCKIPLSVEHSTVEHIIPHSDGGVEISDNLVLACAVCNSARRSTPIEEWNKNKHVAWYDRIIKGLTRIGRIQDGEKKRYLLGEHARRKVRTRKRRYWVNGKVEITGEENAA